MPRPQIFQSYRPTKTERQAVRRFSSHLLSRARGTLRNLADLPEKFHPIEPTILLSLLEDLALGDGYNRSRLALMLDRKAYYLRKRHFYWCCFTHMGEALAPYLYIETEDNHG